MYIFYTGGTTGLPKGVMYRMRDFTEFFMKAYPPMVGLAPVERPEELAFIAKQQGDAGTPTVAMSAPPLMHGTGCWLGMMTPHLMGGTAVLLESTMPATRFLTGRRHCRIGDGRRAARAVAARNRASVREVLAIRPLA